MTIKWKGETQYSAWGRFDKGDLIDTEKKDIPKAAWESWVNTGWAEVVGAQGAEIEAEPGIKDNAASRRKR